MSRHLTIKLLTALLMLFTFTHQSVYAQILGVSYDWELQHDEENIQVYTSDVGGSKFKAVRAITTVQGQVKAAVALVLDFDSCSKWADLCERSEQIKVLSETDSYVYTLNNLPFPVTDRDVVARVFWDIDPESGRVSMTGTATNSDLVPVGKAVRLKDAVSQWHFTQQDDETIFVESFAHIDPNGSTPAWITNMLLIDSPFNTIKRMRKLIESGDYDDVEVPFLAKSALPE